MLMVILGEEGMAGTEDPAGVKAKMEHIVF